MARLRFTVVVVVLGLLAVSCGRSVAGGDPAPVAAEAPTTTIVDKWSVYDPVRGGETVPRDYRPLLARDDIEPVYNPQFVDGSEVDWEDDSLVIGVEIGGEARAYPVAFLTRREMVIDLHQGVATLVTWCPLCGTAMVHDRTIDGEAIMFGNQGALFGNAMTWWDHDTGSIWSQPTGEAILGPRKGAKLKLLTSELVRWGDWSDRHPGTLALDAPNGDIGRTLDDLMVVVELGSETMGFAVPDLRDVGIIETSVAGIPIVVVASPETQESAVFARQLDDRVVHLGLEGGVLVDQQTGSEFHPITGLSLSGDQDLSKLPSFTVFPDDFPVHFPQGLVWAPPQ